MAAGVAAAQAGAKVFLLEKNEKLGKKLFITGHGRCNVTNIASTQDYERKIFRNPRFMRGALRNFSPSDLIALIEQAGIPTKVEDSGRVFPRSDKSSDIIKAFSRTLSELGVEVELHEEVQSVRKEREQFIVRTQDNTYRASSVVIATGGVSYPTTGSTGDGVRFARKLGHSSVTWQPGLAGVIAKDAPIALQGLAIYGILRLFQGDTCVAKEEGEILFTHTGLTGPAVFRAICYLSPDSKAPIRARIRLLASKTEEQVQQKLQNDIAAAPNKDIGTILTEQLPKRLSNVVLEKAQVDPRKKGNQLKKAERLAIAHCMEAFEEELVGPRPIEEAIISIGGIPVKEVNPSTMQSKQTPGLFLAGELLDVSAMTGGYNLQIAFSTGWIAGKSAAQYALGEL